MADSEKLLTVADIAKRAGIRPGDFRTRVGRKKAPKPDDPGDLSVAPQRRQPGWREDTIKPWLDRIEAHRARRRDSESAGQDVAGDR